MEVELRLISGKHMLTSASESLMAAEVWSEPGAEPWNRGPGWGGALAGVCASVTRLLSCIYEPREDLCSC